jgi:Rrf2 family protein
VRLTLSSKYAILALAELARREGLASVTAISAATGIPAAYLAKLLPLLTRHGLVRTARGRQGGVALAKPPAEISLREIIAAVESPAALQDCPFETEPCPGDPACPLYPVWDPLRERILSFLAETNLADVARHPQKGEGGAKS